MSYEQSGYMRAQKALKDLRFYSEPIWTDLQRMKASAAQANTPSSVLSTHFANQNRQKITLEHYDDHGRPTGEVTEHRSKWEEKLERDGLDHRKEFWEHDEACSKGIHYARMALLGLKELLKEAYAQRDVRTIAFITESLHLDKAKRFSFEARDIHFQEMENARNLIVSGFELFAEEIDFSNPRVFSQKDNGPFEWAYADGHVSSRYVEMSLEDLMQCFEGLCPALDVN